MKWFIAFYILSLSASASYTVYNCEDLGDVLSPVKLSADTGRTVYKVVTDDPHSTGVTGLRKELKFTVSENGWSHGKKVLENELGVLKPRDKVLTGTKNVTSSLYVGKMKFPVTLSSGESANTAGKIRIREYLIEDLKTGARTRNPLTDDHVFVEFKMDYPNPSKDPQFENVVNKPRILITRELAQLLIDSRSFKKDPHAFIAVLEAIKPTVVGEVKSKGKVLFNNPHVLVDRFFEAMIALHKDGAVEAMEMSGPIIISYERQSFVLRLNSANGQGDPIEIQITVDRGTTHSNPKTGRPIGSYGDGELIIEVKVPIEHAGLTNADLAMYPQLLVVRNFIDLLNKNHISEYEKHGGKTNVLSRPKSNP